MQRQNIHGRDILTTTAPQLLDLADLLDLRLPLHIRIHVLPTVSAPQWYIVLAQRHIFIRYVLGNFIKMQRVITVSITLMYRAQRRASVVSLTILARIVDLHVAA